MQRNAILRILGIFLMVFSISMVPPIGVSLYFNDGTAIPFALAAGGILLLGLLLWWPTRNVRKDMRLRDGFLIVALFWITLALAGALPLMLSEHPHLTLAKAVFESMSGMTTTGATVIVGLDDLPKSVLYYRQQLNWLGGMGIVVLAVAVLPMLGIGGMQLYRAETPGPMKDSKLTPRITETAKALWYVYLGLTIACALAYWAAGMTLFDAIGHSFATLATGGFSTHDASIGYFNSGVIESIAIFFMVLGGINFSLHFIAWRRVSFRGYFADEEVRLYFYIIIGVSALISAWLFYTATVTDPLLAYRQALFSTVTMMTSTGFVTADFSQWPGMLPGLLILISFVGGCAGSSAGGIKVIRFLLLFKQGRRETLRLIHPQAQLPVKYGGRPVEDRVIDSVWGFFSMYMALYVIMSLVLAGSGLDLVTAFSAVATCMNNAGPALGQVASNFSSVGDFDLWVLSFAMLLGRLEVFTILVLLTPAFWRN